MMALGVPSVVAQTTQTTTGTNLADRSVLNLKVIEGVEVKLSDRSIFYNRIAPPPKPQRTPAPVPIPLTPEQTTAAEARAKKKFEVLMIFATIYDHRLTELRWFADNREYRAWSNIDFNLFSGQGEIETADSIYTLIMGIAEDSVEGVDAENQRAASLGWTQRKELPAAGQFSQTRAEYFLESTGSDPEPSMEALAPIDALHTYHDANRTRLADESFQREAARIAQELRPKEHPPVPKDTVIHFWPKKSRVYPTTEK